MTYTGIRSKKIPAFTDRDFSVNYYNVFFMYISLVFLYIEAYSALYDLCTFV